MRLLNSTTTANYALLPQHNPMLFGCATVSSAWQPLMKSHLCVTHDKEAVQGHAKAAYMTCGKVEHATLAIHGLRIHEHSWEPDANSREPFERKSALS